MQTTKWSMPDTIVPHANAGHFISLPLRTINWKSLSQQAKTMWSQLQEIKFPSSNIITNHVILVTESKL